MFVAIGVLVLGFHQPGRAVTPRPSNTQACAGSDSAAARAVRARLNEWVGQHNSGDTRGASEVWSRDMKGWFPSAPIFTDSAAAATAGVAYDRQRPLPRSEYSIVIDDVAGSGSVIAVHDIWTERKSFTNPRRVVERTIRGSELWRCESDGRWRIARFVSAPEPWRLNPDAEQGFEQTVRAGIAERYAHQADAYRRRDAAAFIDNLAADFSGRTAGGNEMTRAQIASSVGERMARVENPVITVQIDSVRALGAGGVIVRPWSAVRALPDSVEVFSAQRFSRTVRDSAGVAREVSSTQRHRERWRRLGDSWRIYFLEELGGA